MIALCINHPNWIRGFDRKAEKQGRPQEFPQGIKTNEFYEILENVNNEWVRVLDNDGQTTLWNISHFEMIAY